MTCAITTSFLGCIVTLSLYFRYIFFINTPATYKFISLIIALMFGCIPLFVSYKFENLLGNFYTTYRYTLYYIYVGCIILFSLSILRDALWFIAHKISPQHIVSPFAREYHLSNSLINLGIAIILTTSSRNSRRIFITQGINIRTILNHYYSFASLFPINFISRNNPENYGFVLGVTMGRVLVATQFYGHSLKKDINGRK